MPSFMDGFTFRSTPLVIVSFLLVVSRPILAQQYSPRASGGVGASCSGPAGNCDGAPVNENCPADAESCSVDVNVPFVSGRYTGSAALLISNSDIILRAIAHRKTRAGQPARHRPPPGRSRPGIHWHVRSGGVALLRWEYDRQRDKRRQRSWERRHPSAL